MSSPTQEVSTRTRSRIGAISLTTIVVAAIVAFGGWWGLGSPTHSPSAHAQAPVPAAAAQGAKLSGTVIDDPYPAGARAAYLAALPPTATTSAVMLDAGLKVCQAKRSAVPAKDLPTTATTAGAKKQDAQTVVTTALAKLCP